MNYINLIKYIEDEDNIIDALTSHKINKERVLSLKM